MDKRERPINLKLLAFRFPLPALASIAHRITGLMLFVGMAFLLYAWDLALQSPEGLAHAKALIAEPLGKFIAWGILSLIGYHFIAGIKHLVMDFGIGETLQGGRVGAQLSIFLGVVLAVLAGVWVW